MYLSISAGVLVILGIWKSAKKYAALKKDSFMQDLIERKEPALRAEGDLYEVSSFFAFKNMFLARYPECRNIYKVEKKIKEFEERQKNKE